MSAEGGIQNMQSFSIQLCAPYKFERGLWILLIKI